MNLSMQIEALSCVSHVNLVFPDTISNLQIGVRLRLRIRVQVLSSEHAHFESSGSSSCPSLNVMRVPSTENSYSRSFSYSNRKVANMDFSTTAKSTSPQNITSHCHMSFPIIPPRSRPTMWVRYPRNN